MSCKLARRFAEAEPLAEKEQVIENYQNLLPKTEVADLREKAGDGAHGFDNEDRSFSDDVKAKNLRLMARFARAVPDYVGGSVKFGVDHLGFAMYAYDAYKNRDREDPVLLRLQQSPAYRAAVKE